MDKTDLNTWLSTKQNYFCLKTPSSPTVTIYGLGDSPSNDLNQPAVLVCPFESKSPSYWPIMHQWVISIEQVKKLELASPKTTLPPTTTNTSSGEYQEAVSNALQEIAHSSVEKVVLAQINTQPYNNLSISQAYYTACSLTDSFAYALKINQEHWLGASPELFLRSDYKTCETVALAGTRLTSETNVHWGDKEMQEQSVVARFIAGTFENMGLTEVTIGKQFTKSFGHIQHICNPVTANIPNDLDWTELMSSLHPTPALAGFPKHQALNFIKKTESFSRNLYGGFLGVMDANQIELFVNIRCAQLFNNGALLYAGAGINADSIPTKEWEETQNKLEVMKAILG